MATPSNEAKRGRYGSGGDGASGGGGGGTRTPTEGIARTRERRAVVPLHNPRRVSPPPLSGGRRTDSGNAGGVQQGERKKVRSAERPRGIVGQKGVGDESEERKVVAKESSAREKSRKRVERKCAGRGAERVAPSKEDARRERAKLEELVGVGVYEELTGTDRERLADMGAIIGWEKQPVAIYNSMMAKYSDFSRNMEAAQHRQWQRFLRTYLRRLKRRELQDYIRELSPVVASRLRSLIHETGMVWDTWLETSTPNSLVAPLIAVAYEHSGVRLRLLSAQPHILLPSYATRIPPTPKASVRLDDVFGDTALGRAFLAALTQDDIDSLERLRASPDWEVGRALDQVVPSSDLGKLAPDGPADRLLHALYGLGVQLPWHYLSRHHAVYEWQASVQETIDAELLMWERWLQPGQRVAVKMWLWVPLDNAAPFDTPTIAAFRTASAIAPYDELPREWPPSAERAWFKRYVHLQGTVVNYHEVAPAPTPFTQQKLATSVQIIASPTCTVTLDDDQFPWRSRAEKKLGVHDRTLTFTSDSADLTVQVQSYMSQHADKWRLDAPVAPVLWLGRARQLVTNLVGLQSPEALASGFCIEPSHDMIVAGTKALAVRGQSLLILRQVTRAHVAVVEHVEGRVLHGGTNESTKMPFLSVWADGHVLTFAPTCVSAESCSSCVAPLLSARRFEASGTAQQFVISYSLSLTAPLRARVQRFDAIFPEIFGDYAPLKDLVSQMLL